MTSSQILPGEAAAFPDTAFPDSSPQSVNPTPSPSHQVGDETSRGMKLSRNKQLMFLVPIMVLVIGGFIGVAGGFFNGKSSSSAAGDSVSLGPAIPVPQAQNQPVNGESKYGYASNNMGTGASSLRPSQSELEADQSAKMLTGKDKAFEIGSNESISDADYRAVNTSAPATANPYEQKRQLAQSFQQQQSRSNVEQQQVMRTMYQMPKSREQLAQERREQEEQAYQRQVTERIMGNMERSQQLAEQTALGARPVNAPGGAVGIPGPVGPPQQGTLPAEGLQSEAYQQAKAYYGGKLPEPLQRMYAREIEAENRQGGPVGQDGNTIVLAGSPGTPQTRSISRRNGFYGLNAQRHMPASSQNKANLAIPAVIHGDADVITVTDGSTVKLRVLENVDLLLNGEEVHFAANSLISGVCSLNGERVQITITNLRLGNYLYEATLSVFDMDGRPGVRVPDMQTKTQASQMLVQSGTGMSQMPYITSGSGNVGQQFANQMAFQGANQLFQGARNLALQRTSRPKASIRANYRVLLKGGRYASDRAQPGPSTMPVAPSPQPSTPMYTTN